MKRNVLIVLHQLSFGGIQKSCIDALNAIDYDKYQVTLYIRKNRLSLLEQINSNVNVIVNQDATHYYRKPTAIGYMILSYIAKVFKNVAWEKQCTERLNQYINERQMLYEERHYFRDKNFDVAVSYIGGYSAVFTAKKVCADKKYLFFHGSQDEYREIQKNVVNSFQGLVAVNSEIASLIKKWYPDMTDYVLTIDNCVDDVLVRKKAQEMFVDTKGKQLCLCSCGRYTKVKGYDLAIHAASILKEKGIDFVWYFVGDGPERVSMEKQIAELDLQDEVILTGMQKNPYPYINSCDIYIQPSRAEAQPLTLIESMILMKTCVSTKTVGGKYLLQDGVTGVLTEINGESIAEGIERLISDEELRDTIIRNLKKIDYEGKKQQYQESWEYLLSE